MPERTFDFQLSLQSVPLEPDDVTQIKPQSLFRMRVREVGVEGLGCLGTSAVGSVIVIALIAGVLWLIFSFDVARSVAAVLAAGAAILTMAVTTWACVASWLCNRKELSEQRRKRIDDLQRGMKTLCRFQVTRAWTSESKGLHAFQVGPRTVVVLRSRYRFQSQGVTEGGACELSRAFAPSSMVRLAEWNFSGPEPIEPFPDDDVFSKLPMDSLLHCATVDDPPVDLEGVEQSLLMVMEIRPDEPYSGKLLAALASG